MFDFVDGIGAKAKPIRSILVGAELLGIAPEAAVVFEDAQAGEKRHCGLG